MQTISAVQQLRAHLSALRAQGLSIGFVPTMGALHHGHLALVKRALAENDVAVCSIFVNPTQFNNPDDLARYPRTQTQDADLLEKVGCHVLFCPTEAEMYAQKPRLQLHFGPLESDMEGKHRPGHFNGVGLVVAKLFHMVQPQRAYFGLKDLQQCLVVKQLVNDLSFDIDLVLCPTVREADGLAMSSRNVRLGEQHRQQAPQLYQALQLLARQLQEGQSIAQARQAAADYLQQSGEWVLEYLEVADADTLQLLPQAEAGRALALCAAASLGGVRLIDNLLITL